MEALSDALIEQQQEGIKPDPDSFQTWLNHSCTQWHLNDIKVRHQELLEIMGTFDSGNTEDDSKGFYKLQGGLEAVALIITEIEDAYYPRQEEEYV